MNKKRFQFNNQNYCQEYQKESFSESYLKKLVVFSGAFVFIIFLCLKMVSLDSKFSFFSDRDSKELVPEDQPKEESYIFPLLVNLKGDKGPQLVRVQVHIHMNKENSFAKSFSEEDNPFKKYLLFILSGQSTQKLGKNKESFEKQIRFQLNAFLNKELVNGVHIQMEKLN